MIFKQIIILISIVGSSRDAVITSIDNQHAGDWFSLGIHNDLAFGGYYDGRKINAFECLSIDCESRNNYILDDSSDQKDEATSIGRGHDGKIYLTFYNRQQNQIKLASMSSNNILNPDVITLADQGVGASMVMWNGTNPMIVFRNNTNKSLGFIYCSYPILVTCRETNGKVLDDYNPSSNDGVGISPQATLDNQGHLNACYNGYAIVKYIRCLDKYCDTTYIEEISSSLNEMCISIDVNTRTNFVSLLLRTAEGYLSFVKCNDLSCSQREIHTFNDVEIFSASLKIASSGFPRITFYDRKNGAKNLVQINCLISSCSLSNMTILDEYGDVGGSNKLVLDSNDLTIVIYKDNTNPSLNYYRSLQITEKNTTLYPSYVPVQASSSLPSNHPTTTPSNNPSLYPVVKSIIDHNDSIITQNITNISSNYTSFNTSSFVASTSDIPIISSSVIKTTEDDTAKNTYRNTKWIIPVTVSISILSLSSCGALYYCLKKRIDELKIINSQLRSVNVENVLNQKEGVVQQKNDEIISTILRKNHEIIHDATIGEGTVGSAQGE